MLLSTAELAKAKDAAGALLEELGLEAYLYQVEPRDGAWELRVDCAAPEGWQSSVIALDKALLLAVPDDADARRTALATLRERLAHCREETK